MHRTPNHVMVDLETMGTSNNAAIIAIGAVKFNKEKITDRFYKVVSLRSSVEAGLSIEADTVMWWMEQSDEARRALLKPSRPLRAVLIEFATWLGENPVVWGNGSDFDNTILSNAYKRCELIAPWQYYNNRCFRTMRAMFPHIAFERPGTYHNALDDAENQAKHLIKILNWAQDYGSTAEV